VNKAFAHSPLIPIDKLLQQFRTFCGSERLTKELKHDLSCLTHTGNQAASESSRDSFCFVSGVKSASFGKNVA